MSTIAYYRRIVARESVSCIFAGLRLAGALCGGGLVDDTDTFTDTGTSVNHIFKYLPPAHCPEHFFRFRGRFAVNFTVTISQHWLALDVSRYPSSSPIYSLTMMKYANRSAHDIHERRVAMSCGSQFCFLT